MKRRLAALMLTALPLALGLATAARAEGPRFATRDAACEPFITVQFLDCRVRNVYHCPGVDDAKGPLIREEDFTEEGSFGYNVSTEAGILLEQFAPSNVLVLGNVDKAAMTPLSEVAASGGSGHMELRFKVMALDRTVKVDVRVTPETGKLSLGKFVLPEMDYALDMNMDGIGQMNRMRKVYYMADQQYFFEGEQTGGFGYDPAKPPHRPMFIALPGDDGFLTTKPAFCGPNVG